MRLWLFIVIGICCTSFHAPVLYLWNKIDMDDEGKYILVSPQNLPTKLIAVDNPQQVQTLDMPLSGNMYKAILSGDGEQVVWGNNHQVAKATRNDSILKPNFITPVNGRTWLDLDCNEDGSIWVATIDDPDSHKNGQRRCSPGKRRFVIGSKYTDSTNITHYPMNGKVEECRFINVVRLMNDSTVIFQFGDYGIYESVKTKGEWITNKILPVEYILTRQPVAKTKDRLLVWKRVGEDNGGSFELLLLDKKDGKWSEPYRLIPDLPINAGPWHTAISPDGDKIVYMEYVRDSEQMITQTTLYISRFQYGKWTMPTVLKRLQKFGEPWRQTGDIVLSNRNLLYDDMSYAPKLITSLDGDGEVISIKIN